MNKMIPGYPTFCKFNISLKNNYENIYHKIKYEPYSEYSFPNLVSWLNSNDTLELSTLNSNLIMRFDLPDNPGNYYYQFYGDDQIDKSLQIILENNKIREITAVPEFSIKKIKNSGLFIIRDDRDDWEYIFETRNLSEPRGNRNKKFRQAITKFKRDYQDRYCIETKTLDKKVAKQLKVFIDRIKSKNDFFNTEHNALKNVFLFGEIIEAKVTKLSIEGSLVGFAVFYQLTDDCAQFSHIKVDYKYNNSFDFLTYSVANYLCENNFQYINYEQDLGIGGIRLHKTKMHPSMMLKKYTVSLNKN